MFLEYPRDLGTLLIRHETHRDLGVGYGRKNRLGTLSDVSTPDSAHIQARPYADPLKRSVTLLATQGLDSHRLLKLLEIERSPCKLRPVLSGKLHDIVIESRDCDASVLVDQP